jgi:hypothetical protein
VVDKPPLTVRIVDRPPQLAQTVCGILRKLSPRLPHIRRQLHLRRRVVALLLDLRRAEDERNLGPVPRALGVGAAGPQGLVRELAAVEVAPRGHAGVAAHLRGEAGRAARGLVGGAVDLGAGGGALVVGVADEDGLRLRLDPKRRHLGTLTALTNCPLGARSAPMLLMTVWSSALGPHDASAAPLVFGCVASSTLVTSLPFMQLSVLVTSVPVTGPHPTSCDSFDHVLTAALSAAAAVAGDEEPRRPDAEPDCGMKPCTIGSLV